LLKRAVRKFEKRALRNPTKYTQLRLKRLQLAVKKRRSVWARRHDGASIAELSDDHWFREATIEDLAMFFKMRFYILPTGLGLFKAFTLMEDMEDELSSSDSSDSAK
jgi:hypothetical protein